MCQDFSRAQGLLNDSQGVEAEERVPGGVAVPHEPSSQTETAVDSALSLLTSSSLSQGKACIPGRTSSCERLRSATSPHLENLRSHVQNACARLPKKTGKSVSSFKPPSRIAGTGREACDTSELSPVSQKDDFQEKCSPLGCVQNTLHCQEEGKSSQTFRDKKFERYSRNQYPGFTYAGPDALELQRQGDVGPCTDLRQLKDRHRLEISRPRHNQPRRGSLRELLQVLTISCECS